MRRIQIQHLTRYHYAETVTLLPHTLLLRPREGHDIRVLSSKLDISPAFKIRWSRDVYGNSIAIVDFQQRSDELVINSEVVVEHYEEQPLLFVLDELAQHFPVQYDPAELIDLTPYQTAIFPDDQAMMKDWVAGLFQTGWQSDTVTLLNSINCKIANELGYSMREEPGVQSPAQTLSMGTGSCRDFATLFIEICRCFGLASRFISGYVLNEAVPDGHTATHAWSEVYLPGAGWRGFDSTSGLVVSGDHIAAAVHRHPQAVPPVAGSYIGAANTQPILTVDVRVIRVL